MKTNICFVFQPFVGSESLDTDKIKERSRIG